MLVIGLVGATGAGKTEVLKILGELGARTIAADELSREVLAPGQPALTQLRAVFGDEYFDAQGHLIRKALGNLIFADEAARQRLDAIVHPLMVDLLQQRLTRWRQEGVAVAVVESAVLEEMGARPLVDKVVRVEAAEALRLRRLSERDGLTEDEARRRLQTHSRLALDGTQADLCLANEAERGGLRKQVEHLWQTLVVKS
ncbi:MAG: dephospho-CoA kinase [Armatimonadota bacterium]